ncbi:hypothetical protein N9R79_03865 [Vibrio sp.]|nr:hypothetical protein [Vibrio sp.]
MMNKKSDYKEIVAQFIESETFFKIPSMEQNYVRTMYVALKRNGEVSKKEWNCIQGIIERGERKVQGLVTHVKPHNPYAVPVL